VLLDWVPAHFQWTTTDCGAATEPALRARGSRLGEHQDGYGDLNFGRTEVAQLSDRDALFGFDKYQSTGCASTAVASMLYLDIPEKEGE